MDKFKDGEVSQIKLNPRDLKNSLLKMKEKLADKKNYVADHEAFFDLICPGCEDLNRPLIDDMLGSSE